MLVEMLTAQSPWHKIADDGCSYSVMFAVSKGNVLMYMYVCRMLFGWGFFCFCFFFEYFLMFCLILVS